MHQIDSSRIITIALPNNSGQQLVNTSSSDTSSDESDSTAAATMVPSSSNTSPAEYLPIPTLHIVTGGNRTVSSGADTAFSAAVYDSKGNKRDDTVVTWSFGDGMRRTGASVFHKYYEPGEYLAVVRTTTADGGDALKEIVITVKDAGIKIASVSSRGIMLANTDSRMLDLSLWRLSMGGQEFKIPEDTQILAGRTILFPSQVIELPIANSASLLYPSGEIAATYPLVLKEQLSASNASSNVIQAVEPIISTTANIQTHEEAVRAPAPATELAGAGAALSSPTTSAEAGVLASNSPISSILRSPWTLGFLSVVALAGGAFIFI